MSMPNRIKAFLTNSLCWGYAQSSFRRNPLGHLKPALWAPKVPRPGNRRWSLLACSSPSKWLTPSGIQARLWSVGIEKYVTDEALTAQAVETPCTPLAAAFPTLDLASCFAVDVTEMAKLGPERCPLLNSNSSRGRIALVAYRAALHALGMVQFDLDAIAHESF